MSQRIVIYLITTTWFLTGDIRIIFFDVFIAVGNDYGVRDSLVQFATRTLSRGRQIKAIREIPTSIIACTAICVLAH